MSGKRDRPCLQEGRKRSGVACHNCETWYHWACAGIKSKNKLPKYYFHRINTKFSYTSF